MAQAREGNVEARIQAHVDVFIEGVTAEEAVAIREKGPSALQSACFAWAFAAVDEILDAEAPDVTTGSGLRERAPLVTRLRQLAFEAFSKRFGAPPMPTLPERPAGLDLWIQTEQDEAACRRMSRSARSLCHKAVYGFCSSWQEWYYVTRNRDRSEFVLWLKWEDGESYRRFTTEHASCTATKGLSERDAALILLEAYWTAMRDEWGTGRPSEFSANGDTITQDELWLVAERVWPEAKGASPGG